MTEQWQLLYRLYHDYLFDLEQRPLPGNVSVTSRDLVCDTGGCQPKSPARKHDSAIAVGPLTPFDGITWVLMCSLHKDDHAFSAGPLHLSPAHIFSPHYDRAVKLTILSFFCFFPWPEPHQHQQISLSENDTSNTQEFWETKFKITHLLSYPKISLQHVGGVDNNEQYVCRLHIKKRSPTETKPRKA